MSQKDKLIAKLRSKPKTFTFDEAELLLGYLSRKELLEYQVKQLLEQLEQEGLI